MAVYYEEIAKKMRLFLQEKRYEEVAATMREELSLPYVPTAYEEMYERFYQEAQSAIQANKPYVKGIVDAETFEALLYDELLETQLLAVESLKELHITPYLPLILRYLEAPMYQEVQSLLIYELIDKEVREECITYKEGLQFSFVPYYLELPEESDGYLGAAKLLCHHIHKNPSLLQLCMQILQVQCMKQLPLLYEEDEAEALAFGVIKYACEAMQDSDLWQQCKEKMQICEEKLVKIEIA